MARRPFSAYASKAQSDRVAPEIGTKKTPREFLQGALLTGEIFKFILNVAYQMRCAIIKSIRWGNQRCLGKHKENPVSDHAPSRKNSRSFMLRHCFKMVGWYCKSRFPSSIAAPELHHNGPIFRVSANLFHRHIYYEVVGVLAGP